MDFLGLPAELSRHETSRYVVLPVPYDATTSYRGGARLGPAAILDASRQVETFDQELLVDVSGAGVFTAEPVHPPVAGPEQAVREVERAARRFAADGKFVLALGGEHSITTGLVRAVLGAKQPSRGRTRPRPAGRPADTRAKPGLGVLQIDAHADLRDEYEGSPYSHAAVCRRLHQDLKLPLAQVGIRSFCQEEHDYMRAHGLEPFTPWAIQADPAGWIERALARLPERIYVTIDIDGFDPAYAPGTGTPEPGGLDWGQVTGLLRAAAGRKLIVGADIVEVAPIPGQHVTEFLAARLAYKLLTYIEAARSRQPRGPGASGNHKSATASR